MGSSTAGAVTLVAVVVYSFFDGNSSGIGSSSGFSSGGGFSFDYNPPNYGTAEWFQQQAVIDSLRMTSPHGGSQLTTEQVTTVGSPGTDMDTSMLSMIMDYHKLSPAR